VWGGLCGTGTPFNNAQGKALSVAFDFDIEISEIKIPTFFRTEREKGMRYPQSKAGSDSRARSKSQAWFDSLHTAA
jgi:hypothetical protein